MVHLLSGMMFTLGWNEVPGSAQALGGIYRWKEGRNMPDIHTVLFDYHGIPVYVRLGLGTESPELARFMVQKVFSMPGNSVSVIHRRKESIRHPVTM